MPEIGTEGMGRDLGKTPERAWFRWEPCSLCGESRWARFRTRDGKVIYSICKWCANKGERNSHWAGGKNETIEGYIRIRIFPDSPFHPMADTQGRVMEHRLVMAQHLGRCLEDWELVHHKGVRFPIESVENRQDNRADNLELTTNGEHVSQHRQGDIANGADPFHGHGYRRKY
jgi:hypothetical protein